MKANRSLLDLVRGVAALLVLLTHYRTLLMESFGSGSMYPAWKALYFISGFGGDAVMIFFVLSGLLISGTIDTAMKSKQWSWRRYLINRSVRLELVLIPALLFGAGLDYAGLHLSNYPEVYSATTPTAVGAAHTAESLRMGIGLGNALFLQTILCPTFGSNGPLWSLANEFWYYLAYPCAVFCFVAQKRWAKILYGTLFLGMICFVGKEIASLGLVWLTGVLVYFISTKIKQASFKQAMILIGIGTLSAVALLTWKRTSQNFDSNIFYCLLLGALIGLTCLGMVLLPGRIPDVFGRCFKVIAERSYSYYLLHLPFGLWLSANTFGIHRFEPRMQSLPYLIAFLGAFFLYAEIVYRLFEANTGKARKVMYRLFRVQ